MSLRFSWSCALRALHSFPTRRSSDLVACQADGRGGFSGAVFPRGGAGGRGRCVAARVAHPGGRHVGRFGRTEIEIQQRTNRRGRSEEHTSELQSRFDLVCRLLLEKKK